MRDIAADIESFLHVSFFERYGPDLSGTMPHIAMLNTVLKTVFAIASICIILPHIAADVVGIARFCARVATEPTFHAKKGLRHTSRLFRWFIPRDSNQFDKGLESFLLFSYILIFVAYGNLGKFLLDLLRDLAAFVHRWRVFPLLSTAMTFCIIIGETVFGAVCSRAWPAAGASETRKFHSFTFDSSFLRVINQVFKRLSSLMFGAIILFYVAMGLLSCGDLMEFYWDFDLSRGFDSGAVQQRLEYASIACIIHLFWIMLCYLAFLLLAHAFVAVCEIVAQAFGRTAEMKEEDSSHSKGLNDPGDLIPEGEQDDNHEASQFDVSNSDDHDASQLDVSDFDDQSQPVTAATQPSSSPGDQATTAEKATGNTSQFDVSGLGLFHSFDSDDNRVQDDIDEPEDEARHALGDDTGIHSSGAEGQSTTAEKSTSDTSHVDVSGLGLLHSLGSDDDHFQGDMDDSEDEANQVQPARTEEASGGGTRIHISGASDTSHVDVSGLGLLHSRGSDDDRFQSNMDDSEDEADQVQPARTEEALVARFEIDSSSPGDQSAPVTTSTQLILARRFEDDKAEALRIIIRKGIERVINEARANTEKKQGAYLYVCNCPICVSRIIEGKIDRAKQFLYTKADMEGVTPISVKMWDEQGRTDADMDVYLVLNEHGLISPDHRLAKKEKRVKKTTQLRTHYFMELWSSSTASVGFDSPEVTFLKNWVIPKIARLDKEVDEDENKLTLEKKWGGKEPRKKKSNQPVPRQGRTSSKRQAPLVVQHNESDSKQGDNEETE